MRLLISTLACLGAGGLGAALADSPPVDSATATPAAAAAATSTASSSVTITGEKPAPPAPAGDLDDRHFLAEGYKLEMRHGEQYFCRREEVLGTRLGGQKVCSTAIQLKATEQQAKRSLDRNMLQQNNPSNSPTPGMK